MTGTVAIDNPVAELKCLKEQAAKLRQHKKELARQLRNAQRKHKRLKEKAKQLSDNDLLSVMLIRQEKKLAWKPRLEQRPLRAEQTTPHRRRAPADPSLAYPKRLTASRTRPLEKAYAGALANAVFFCLFVCSIAYRFYIRHGTPLLIGRKITTRIYMCISPARMDAFMTSTS